MKRMFLILMLIFGIILTGCVKSTSANVFSYGDELVFLEKNGTYYIDLEKSSNRIIEKHQKLLEILKDKETLKDIAAVTTTTANILSTAGIELTAAPESQSLDKNIKDRQYKISETGSINKKNTLNIGSPLSPNIEALVELNPKLVLYSDSIPKSKFLETINSSGLKVYPLPQSDYVDMFILLDIINIISENQNQQLKDLINQNVNNLKSIEENISKTNNDQEKTVAILQVSEGRITAENDTTVLGRISKSLDIKNVFSNIDNGELNREQLIAQNPDYIIYYSHGMDNTVIENFEKELLGEEGIYRDLDAVKNNKTFQVKSDNFTFSSSVDLDIIKVIKFLSEKFYE